MVQPSDDRRPVALADVHALIAEVVRCGVERLVHHAVHAEVADWIDRHWDCRDAGGRRQVVRNGYLPARAVRTGVGTIEFKQPRVYDRRGSPARQDFRSALVRPYYRNLPPRGDSIPWLYFQALLTVVALPVLTALLGRGVAELSPGAVNRLTELWCQECRAWRSRELGATAWTFFWADHIPASDQGLLILLGAAAGGAGELLALREGARASVSAWRYLLDDVQTRGLVMDPARMTAAPDLGIWEALMVSGGREPPGISGGA